VQPLLSAPAGPPLGASYCAANSGLVLYNSATAPVTSYSAAVGTCAAVGRAAASVALGGALPVANAVLPDSIATAMGDCGAPNDSYFNLAEPGTSVSDTDFCTHAHIQGLGVLAAYTATYSADALACGSSGFGALVVCA